MWLQKYKQLKGLMQNFAVKMTNGRTDGRTNELAHGRTDGKTKTIHPLTYLVCRDIIIDWNENTRTYKVPLLLFREELKYCLANAHIIRISELKAEIANWAFDGYRNRRRLADSFGRVSSSY